MNTNATKPKTRDVRFIKIDETQYWDKDFLKKTGAKRVYACYFYDASRHVHCCSVTPSYEFHFIESQTDVCLSDEHNEEVRDVDSNAERVSYYQTSGIDTIPVVDHFPLIGSDSPKSMQTKEEYWNTIEIDPDKTDEEIHDDFIEEVLEYCRGNSI